MIVGTFAPLPSGCQCTALFLPPAASLAAVPSVSGHREKEEDRHAHKPRVYARVVSLKYVIFGRELASRSAKCRMVLLKWS